MTKYFCDLCEAPVDGKPKLDVESGRKVLSDETARIHVNVNIGFHLHSSGFGGPPDLCNVCLRALLDLMKGNFL